MNIKDRLLKTLFPDAHEELMVLRAENSMLEEELEEQPKDLLAPLDFSSMDDSGLPPHYLKDLDSDQRKSFIADMEQIRSSKRFMKVVDYTINWLGNHSFMVEPDEAKMANDRHRVIGIRTLMHELDKMHSEFLGESKPPEEFDPLAVLPE